MAYNVAEYEVRRCLRHTVRLVLVGLCFINILRLKDKERKSRIGGQPTPEVGTVRQVDRTPIKK